MRAAACFAFALLLAACGGSDATGSGGSSSTDGGGTGGHGGAGSSSSSSSSSGSVSMGGSGGSTGSSSSGSGTAGGGTGGAVSYGPCEVGGVPGDCIDVTACAALPDHGATPGYCPGPAEIQCCTEGPSVSDNPPIPTGWKTMTQADVTPEMTAWAVDILHDPATYPMFSTAEMVFGTLDVLARVEWHPPDFQNGKVHRGVTLYEPI